VGLSSIEVYYIQKTWHRGREAIYQPKIHLYGTGRAHIVLRSVNLIHLEQLITGERKMKNERERTAFARRLAFGEESA
jgi:hypothetical protein